MCKKILNVIRNVFVVLAAVIFAFVAYLILCSTLLTMCSSIDSEDANGEHKEFRWIKEESHFVDYTISGDTIQFRYSICFENTSGYDILVSSVTADFEAHELDGWLKKEKSYNGELIGDEQYALIPNGEKVSVIFMFEGTYLGGEVNEDLSFPIELVFAYKFATSDSDVSSP